MLQDSLGGNAKTLMIATLSPVDYNYEESISTLRYANRAKNIKNKPKKNEDPKDAMLREFQEEIKRLKAQLEGDNEFQNETQNDHKQQGKKTSRFVSSNIPKKGGSEEDMRISELEFERMQEMVKIEKQNLIDSRDLE